MDKPDNNEFRLKLIDRSPKELKLFAEMTIELVIEADKKPVDDEIIKIQSQYHVDHVWILKNSKVFGVVKLLRGTFYGLGLPIEASNKDLDQIFQIVERDIKSYHSYTVEATIHESLLKVALERNYEFQFSRKKMELSLKTAKRLVDFSELIINKFYNKDLYTVIDLFIDAYKDSVDERVGMFGEKIAHSAIRSILRGNFGIFRPDLSGLIHTDSGELIAAVLISISEECPFIVIIGVKRAIQNNQYGKKLLSWTIKSLITEGFEKLRLWVTIENTTALRIYESMGFEEIFKIHAVIRQLDH